MTCALIRARVLTPRPSVTAQSTEIDHAGMYASFLSVVRVFRGVFALCVVLVTHFTGDNVPH